MAAMVTGEKRNLEDESTNIQKLEVPIKRFKLDNGLTIIVHSTRNKENQAHIPKVSVQMWYDVGSRDEDEGTRGIAHLIEHMIFKGTDILSESDINTFVQMFSGNCNAFTSYDYTGYLFNFPSHQWTETLPVIADCMRNCSFKPDMLNSEMKAVIQELKMYKDSYMQSLVEELISTIFNGHPYHHPIIGYKHDLWNVQSDDLKKFYDTYYHPGNAALIVVGDVDPEEVLAQAKKHFGSLPSGEKKLRHEFPMQQDVAARSVTLYRDVQRPTVMFSFVVPGVRKKKDHLLHILEWILARGRGSRLYQRLVHELGIATAVQANTENLFDGGLLFIICEPRTVEDIPEIERQVRLEIERLTLEGVVESEFVRAYKQARISLYALLEDYEAQAYEMGYYLFAADDPEYPFTCFDTDSQETLKDEMMVLARTCLRPTVMHRGMILPVPESERCVLADLQKQSDEEDNAILTKRSRSSEVEPPSYSNQLTVLDAPPFIFPKSEEIVLSNGVKVLYCNNPHVPKISLILSLRAKHYFDSDDKQGLLLFLNRMLVEGTERYPGTRFAQVLEERGISFSAYPGGMSMSMLEEDLPFMLDMLREVLEHASIDADAMERVRIQLLTAIQNFWDEPRSFTGQILREEIYGDHPFSKNRLGSSKTVNAITRDDLLESYQRFITPHGARVAIVGDLRRYDIRNILEDEKELRSVIETATDSITEEELREARNALISAAIDQFGSSHTIAETFLFMDKFGLPRNFFDTRAQQLANIAIDDVKTAVHKVLNNESLLTVRVGRVGKS